MATSIRTFARLRLPKDQVVGTSNRSAFSTSTKIYAAGTTAEEYAARVQATVSTDPRTSAIRKVLFESDLSDKERLEALAKVVPSQEVHETITRAWLLHQRKKRESHKNELRGKYDSMQAAIKLLETVDKSLFDKAVKGRVRHEYVITMNDRLDGLVPREMKPPYEQAGTSTWDHTWKAPEETKQDNEKVLSPLEDPV